MSWPIGLAGGRTCVLKRGGIPFVRHYFVLYLVEEETHTALSPEELDRMWGIAQRAARRLGRLHYNDPEAFSVIYNAGRTRRRPWPHFHLVVASSVGQKRRAFFFLALKRVLRWRRWPLWEWLGLRAWIQV